MVLMLSDEKRFCLRTHYGCGRLRRCRRESVYVRLVFKRHIYRTVEVIVLEAITYGNRLPLIIINFLDKRVSMFGVDS